MVEYGYEVVISDSTLRLSEGRMTWLEIDCCFPFYWPLIVSYVYILRINILAPHNTVQNVRQVSNTIDRLSYW